MQKKWWFLSLALLLLNSLQVSAQYTDSDSTYKKCYLGSSLFLLGNFAGTNSPSFAQLNLGYRLTGKDVVSLELITWKTAWPIGIHPFLNPAYGKPEEAFPGYIRDYGFALAYQRYFWKGLYAQIHVMNAWQSFVNADGNKIDNGFQIFNTYRAGYHIKLWKDRLFIEPSLAITHRPFHTEMPAGFKAQDDKWSKFIFGEPGCHFGVNF